MHKYKMALFIGRFQPFHNGHLYSLNKALDLADEVIVGVGSSQESGTENNPWDFETREKMIKLVTPVKVVAIPDVFNDEKWGELIKNVIKESGRETTEVVGVGNNEWTNRILRTIGVDVHESGLYNRNELEGIKIRELMRRGDDSWKARVPKEIVKFLEEYDRTK